MTTTPSVLLGGTGYIGSHVAEQLRLQGREVIALVRAGSRAEFLRQLACHIREVDFSDPTALSEAIPAGATVYCCIADSRLHQSPEQRHAIEVELIGRLFKAAVASSARRFVQLSTVHVYGFEHDDSPLDETSSTDGEFSYGQAAVAREQNLQRLAKNSPLQLILLRPSETHGPRDPIIAPLIAMHKKGFFAVIGQGNTTTACTDTRDVGRAMVWLGQMPQPAEQVYVVSAFETSMLQIKTALDQQLGKPARLIRLPVPLMQRLAALAEKVLPYTINLSLTPFAIKVVTTATHLDDSRLRATGFTYRYEFEGMIATCVGEHTADLADRKKRSHNEPD